MKTKKKIMLNVEQLNDKKDVFIMEIFSDLCVLISAFIFFWEGEKEREGKNYKNKFQFHLVAFEAFYKCS